MESAVRAVDGLNRIQGAIETVASWGGDVFLVLIAVGLICMLASSILKRRGLL